MSWTPSGPWNSRFRTALDGAFDEGSFTLLLKDYFGEDFAKISPAGFGKTFAFRVQEVLDNARMEDWLLDLVVAARERRPKNAALASIAEALGLTIAGPRLSNTTGKTLEEVIRDNARFINPAVFTERLPRLEGQVCRIDIPGGGGTGFLVAADLVLTNYHVVARIRNGEARAEDVKLRFDYRQALDGSVPTRKNPVTVSLATDWLADSKPPSEFDWEPALGEAGESESDYAILRLAEAIGDLPVGGDTVDVQAEPRGFIDTAGDVPALAAGNQVFLLQHPRGEPLQLAVGAVVGFNQAGTRVRYDANSKGGSSGSPVLDADLRLVALHHARDPAEPPKWNQAIPFSVVKKIWKLPSQEA
ncbi:trypsin-like peptidase domain-containing protein [Thiocapsa bogorovii]|uniref:trypsin-like peptidase domain-containing protein n=1 Tax=Thiocapsa bogorovii TaxID=521689 RepID=UPI001E303F29|nr:trypsin-like peptidase domain-containing protein [Thiocapsa bogorovii]UHD16360.1 serine protease [Thiocapsa bogorovii]